MFALVGALVCIVPYGQDAFPVVPDNHSVYSLAARFQNELWYRPELRKGRGYFLGRSDINMAVRMNGFIYETEAALDQLDGDCVGPAAEVHARAALTSQSTLRKYLNNRRPIVKFLNTSVITRALQGIGADVTLMPSRLREIDRRLASERVFEVMRASDATVNWARPELARIVKALNLDPFPIAHPSQANSAGNWEIARQIQASLLRAREALDELDRPEPWRSSPVQTLDKNSVGVIQVLTQNLSTFNRLIQAFEWELELLGVDTRYAQVTTSRVASTVSRLCRLNQRSLAGH
jgi:hypothetical protein